MKLWIARDFTGLWLYITKPLINPNMNKFEAADGVALYVYGDKMFPGVTFENSPQQIEI